MKKWAGLLLTVVLAVSITACGSKAKENAEPTAANTTKTENSATNQAENKETVPTLEELIKTASEANSELKSYAMDISMAQNIVMEQGEQKQEQKISTTMKGEYIHDPLQMHIATTMDVAGQKQDIEQYVSKDGMYMLVGGTWNHTKDASIDELVKSTNETANVGDQLDQFKTISDQTTIAVEGDKYVISADVSGDQIKTLAKELMAKNAGDNAAQMNQMLDMMNITDMKLTTTIQKDTLFPVSSKVKLIMSMEQDGQKMSMDMDVNASFDKHNAISEITIPQEALDSAK